MNDTRPPRASVVLPGDGEKLHAPSAARNQDSIVAFLRDHAPTKGTALEIASGTGQHVCAYAAALPDMHWQPTDIDPARLKSINAYVNDAALGNVAPAQHLDATVPCWADRFGNQDLIVLVNLLHLISTSQATHLIHEAGKALDPQGMLMLYGPFKRDGLLTSTGDAEFDASLRASDPDIGYKDTADIRRIIDAAGFALVDCFEMPANNLVFLARKDHT
ncbi:generic methyltransferase [Sulfitobacter noctilucicola]|uniref:Cyclopropane fatty-acyl-phospholipid synthase-like methyltransferase n=1 Tax=Sulfitobacter noctilucicola TaxID=1342301 RepID=A0A7W6M9Z2_9RHOB|nr:DUF938 domain-containing protein [Sulfitobacter noctilucicola]KIN63622.1 generic methyltransferase [Sulfitobacter noctilucicola]MBB4174867.1 cyclopropane fatty-acyl-phospholipid synthase-like methyltransferase [Sulfitobacter noctilucicola]